MTTNEITAEEFAGKINEILKSYDDSNAAELDFFSKLLQIKNRQLQNQKEILVQKYGKEDERVVASETGLAFDTEMIQAVGKEMETAKFNRPVFSGTDWRVQGFVYNSQGEKLAGKKILLINSESKEPLKKIRPAVSGANGYYSITLKTEELATLKDIKPGLAMEIKDQEPFIAVKDIRALAGRIDNYDIWLEDGMGN